MATKIRVDFTLNENFTQEECVRIVAMGLCVDGIRRGSLKVEKMV